MANYLVTRTFRYESGALARAIQVEVVTRGTTNVVATVTTDMLGLAAVSLPPGSYDWYVFGARVPFEVVGAVAAEAIAYRQATAASTWVIPHNRGIKPAVTLVIDKFPNEAVMTDVTYPDLATVVVEWPSPESGWAYIQ